MIGFEVKKTAGEFIAPIFAAIGQINRLGFFQAEVFTGVTIIYNFLKYNKLNGSGQVRCRCLVVAWQKTNLQKRGWKKPCARTKKCAGARIGQVVAFLKPFTGKLFKQLALQRIEVARHCNRYVDKLVALARFAEMGNAIAPQAQLGVVLNACGHLYLF